MVIFRGACLARRMVLSTSLCFVLVSGVGAVASAAEQQLKPRFSLIDGQNDNPVLAIGFASAPSPSVLATLAVELDEIDVTRTLRVTDDGTLEVHPATVLAAGSHELRLYRLSSDRRGYELVDIWQFETEALEGWRVEAASVAATHTAALQARAGENWTYAESAGSLYGRAAQGKWTAEGSLDYLAASEKQARLATAPVDVGTYSLSLRHDGEGMDTGIELGNQYVDVDPLLISQLNRRGVSLSLADDDGAYSAKVFGLRSQESTSAANFSGLGRPDERLFGGAVTAVPLRGDWGELETTVSAYKGHGATFGGTATGDGDGMAISARLSTFENRLSLRTSYANSRSDLDGSGAILNEQKGDALSATLDVVLLEPEPGETGRILWTTEYRKVEQNYFSFANPFLTTDLEQVATGMSFAGQSIALQANISRQENNVRDDPLLPKDRATKAGINGSYFPFATDGAPEWLGQAAVNFGVETGLTDRISQPVNFVDVDATGTQAYLGLSAGTSDFSWGVTGAVADFKDNANLLVDQRTWSTLGFMNWTPSDWLTIDGSAQWQHNRTSFSGQSDDFRLETNLEAWLIEDVLSTSAGYAAAVSSESAGYEGWESHLELNWFVAQGHSLSLRGGAANGDAIVTPGRNGREFFAGLVYRISTNVSQ